MYDDTSCEEEDVVVGLVKENADIVVVRMARASGNNSMSEFMTEWMEGSLLEICCR